MRKSQAFFAAMLMASPPAQSIRITSVPTYGQSGVLTGVVGGVSYSTHRVATWLYVDGFGWCSKPTSSSPTVSIRADGTFSVRVVSGGLDDRATHFVVALMGPGRMPPVVCGSCRIPSQLTALALDHAERPGRILNFAGRRWAVKDAPLPVGPGGNRFSGRPAGVWVDGQGLHLTIANRGGHWWSTEVVLLDDVGYGTYWFTTEHTVNGLDPAATFGAFTWDPHCDDRRAVREGFGANREIDFEDGRFGRPSDLDNAQTVVQPYQQARAVKRFRVPRRNPPQLSRWFHWSPGAVDFTVVHGLASPGNVKLGMVVERRSYLHSPATGQRVPSAGRERFRFNLWLTQSAPAAGGRVHVLVSDFRFSPTRGLLPLGCRRNPSRSLSLLSGKPRVGTAPRFGVDNPSGIQRGGGRAILLLGRPSPAQPCGRMLPGFGMTGGSGELLVDSARALVPVAGGLWTGAGRPASVALAIPNSPALVGGSVVVQGLLPDPSPTARVPLGLARAFELVIQP